MAVIDFDPSAIRAELRATGDDWVVVVELARGGSWGHAEASWRTYPVSAEELSRELGVAARSSVAAVVGYVEATLRRTGWRAERSGDPAAPPAVEVWTLSPASDYR